MATPLLIQATTKFHKDAERMKRRGKDLTKMKMIVEMLATQTPLPAKYNDHKLQGEYLHRRECHIEPDWLLIYKCERQILILERTGSHADLFG